MLRLMQVRNKAGKAEHDKKGNCDVSRIAAKPVGAILMYKLSDT